MPAHRHFERNDTGTDYVVGDIHGCFRILMSGLRQLGFNYETDRLFSVGDLVDRGPDSEHALMWLAYPWFHAVRANHEQLCIDTVRKPGEGTKELHAINGGLWFLSLTDLERLEFAEAFEQLPYAITVETPFGDVGIIHADTPDFDSWYDSVRLLEDSNNDRAKLRALWGRERINNGLENVVAGVAYVYCGHTIVEAPTELGNVRFIDTGAYKGLSMTIVNLTTNEVIELSPDKPETVNGAA